MAKDEAERGQTQSRRGRAPLPAKIRRWRDLWRPTLWGLSAAGAVAIAVPSMPARPKSAKRGCEQAFAGVHERLMPSGVKPIEPLDAREGRRLAETVRVLAADRERLMARVETLEHSVEDMTGSIARVQQAARATPPAPPRRPSLPQRRKLLRRRPLRPPRLPRPRLRPHRRLYRPQHRARSVRRRYRQHHAPAAGGGAAKPPSKPKKEFGLDLGSAGIGRGTAHRLGRRPAAPRRPARRLASRGPVRERANARAAQTFT